MIEFYKKRYDGIVTFGGPFSNHLAATSSLCKHFGIKSFGFVRGDEISFKYKPIKKFKKISNKNTPNENPFRVLKDLKLG